MTTSALSSELMRGVCHGVVMIVLAVMIHAAVAEIPSCDVAIIGAGPGGAYTANRLADNVAITGFNKICIFEMRDRVGGRVHSIRNSGPKKDLVVEAGAYRFATNITCEDEGGGVKWCIQTPLTKALILDKLKLRAKRYDPSPEAWDYYLNVIVDDTGNEIGYLTFVEELLRQINLSVPLYFNKELISIDPKDDNGKHKLFFGDGTEVTVQKVILNLPQTPLLRILANSKSLIQSEGEVPEVIHSVVAFPLMKMYVRKCPPPSHRVPRPAVSIK